jgi:hypothetical protein
MGEEFRAVLWDVDLQQFDVEKHAGFLVRRVLEYGTWAQWKLLKQRLGAERIEQIVVSLPRLDPRAAAFCSVIFHRAPESFACFTARPFSPGPWIS